MTPREQEIFRVVNDCLDAVGEDFDDADYMAFLAGIAFYLAHCSVMVNQGKDSRELVEMFCQQLKDNERLLKRTMKL